MRLQRTLPKSIRMLSVSYAAIQIPLSFIYKTTSLSLSKLALASIWSLGGVNLTEFDNRLNAVFSVRDLVLWFLLIIAKRRAAKYERLDPERLATKTRPQQSQ